MYEVVLFDLDGTMYPYECGIMDAIGERVTKAIMNQLQISMEEAMEVRHRFYLKYGTSLRGLYVEHGVAVETFLEYVHDIPHERFISADGRLDEMLNSISLRKVIFTNASSAHAERALNVLGVRRHFETIIDITNMHDYVCKPHESAYLRAMELVGVTEPESCILVEDTTHNLDAPHRMGMTTILVGMEEGYPAADYVVPDIYGAGDVILELAGKKARAAM
jgi:putative hydrolase of the HAD superfamily